MTVPMSEAVLKIPADSLRKLPEAAEYRARSGQASAVVKHRGDTIIVYATCDSLQRQCERYERETALYRDRCEALEQTVRTENERRTNPVKTAIIAFIAGLATGIVLTILKMRRR